MRTRLHAVLPWLGLVARIALGGVLLWAGMSKVDDLSGSVRAVNAYEILPYEAAAVVGSMLPFAEVAIGALLLAGLATRLVGAVSVVLMSAFVAGIAAAWARGLSIDCGCFGGGGQLAAGQRPQYFIEILRDGALLLAAALLVWRPRTPWSVDGWLSRSDPDGADGDGADGDGADGDEAASGDGGRSQREREAAR